MLPLQVLCANDLFQCIMYLSPSITAWRWITSWLCSTNFILLTGSFSCSGLKALFQGPARIKQLLQANFAMNRCTRNFLQQLSDVFQVPKSKTSRKTHDFNTSFRKTNTFSAVLTMEILTSLNQRVIRGRVRKCIRGRSMSQRGSSSLLMACRGAATAFVSTMLFLCAFVKETDLGWYPFSTFNVDFFDGWESTRGCSGCGIYTAVLHMVECCW